jgi:hypothetical protein
MPDVAQGMLSEAVEELARMKVDPSHRFHNNLAAIQKYQEAVETDLALRGETLPTPPTPQERAAAIVENKYPTELEDGMVDLLNSSLAEMVKGYITPGETRRINEHGEAEDLDPEAYGALVDSKLMNIPQTDYDSRRAQMVSTLKLPDGATGEDAYARLYHPAKLAFDRSGNDARLWPAITINAAALKAYAALGSSIQHREQALARVNRTGPGGDPYANLWRRD